MILAVGNEKIYSAQQFTEIVKSSPNKELSLSILRAKDTLSITITPTSEGKIGVGISDIFNPPIEYKSFGLFASFVEAGKDCYTNISLFYSVLKKVITGKVEFAKAFGGPVRIAQIAARSAESNLLTFLNFIALLSLSLAILNILPFPVLDGGHLIIVSIEGILRREISPKVKIALQNVGFVILLLFMAFVIYNDILSF
ncbi:MAG: RIP metalloprotease RseP [Ignavibacteria bacterium]|nr:RIP metalloprotease RseP [Ignavibacteria bacterium]